MLVGSSSLAHLLFTCGYRCGQVKVAETETMGTSGFKSIWASTENIVKLRVYVTLKGFKLLVTAFVRMIQFTYLLNDLVLLESLNFESKLGPEIIYPRNRGESDLEFVN